MLKYQGSNAPRVWRTAVLTAVFIAFSTLLLAYVLPRVLPDQTIARIPLPSLVARAWEANLEKGGNIATGRSRLVRMGGSARDAVRSLLDSKVPKVKAEAYSLLGEVAQPEDGIDIARGMEDDNWTVRRGAIIGLGHLAAKQYFPVLARAFSRESTAELRTLLVLAAGRSGGVIHEAMKDPAWSVRRAYVEVLERIERETFHARQLDLFQDADPRVRRAVALRSIDTSQSRMADEILADSYHQVRDVLKPPTQEEDKLTNWLSSGLRELVVGTLADGGAGSLRWAIEQPGPRRVRFAVHGKILLRDFLVVREPYLVIDGTDAPQGGVELQGYPLVVRGTHHVLVKGIAISGIGEKGDIDPEYADALSVNAGRLPWFAPYYDGEAAVTRDVTVERCSLLDAIDENLEVYQEGAPEPIETILIRSNLIAFGKHDSTHPKGDHSRGLLMGQNLRNVRVEENVFLNNGGRNPFASLAAHAGVSIVRNIVRGWTEQGIGIEALPAHSRAGAVQIEGNILVLESGRQSPLDFRGEICISAGASNDARACAAGAVMIQLLSNRFVRPEALRSISDDYKRIIAEAGWPAGSASRWFPETQEQPRFQR